MKADFFFFKKKIKQQICTRVVYIGEAGIQGPIGDMQYWPTCQQHKHNNNDHDVRNLSSIIVNQETITAYYSQHDHRLPCYILDHVDNNRMLIEHCKSLGATCCYEWRPNLARVLLGIPILKNLPLSRTIQSVFDRAIQLGHIEEVKSLIYSDLAMSNNTSCYDGDFIVYDFLRKELLTHKLHQTPLATCVIDIIIDFFTWYDVKTWLQNVTPKKTLLQQVVNAFL